MFGTCSQCVRHSVIMDDVCKSFGYKTEATACSEIKRLIEAGRAIKHEEYVEDGHVRRKYRKVNQMGM